MHYMTFSYLIVHAKPNREKFKRVSFVLTINETMFLFYVKKNLTLWHKYSEII